MLKRIFGDKHSSPTRRELIKKVERSSFSGFLPWMYYDSETGMYTNTDDTRGFLWECRPLAFAGDVTAQVLEGLFRLNLPLGSIMQFILWADSHIDPVLERYCSLRKRESDIGAESTTRFVDFMSSGRVWPPWPGYRCASSGCWSASNSPRATNSRAEGATFAARFRKY